MELTDYYRGVTNLLDALPDHKFRHFRIHTTDDHFMKLRRKVVSPRVLQDWLVSHPPLSVYYSVALFRRPWLVGSRGSDDADFMGMDLVFDIDEPDDLQRGLEEARKLLTHGAREGWELRYTAFSGSKGFHVVFRDPFSYSSARGVELEEEATERRQVLVEELEGMGMRFDTKVTVDTRRIIRLPYSVHFRTGMLCQPIPAEELLRLDLRQLRGRYMRVVTRPIRNQGGLKAFRRWLSRRSLPAGIRRWLAGRRSTYLFTTTLSNRVMGTSLLVPILEYPVYDGGTRRRLLELLDTYRLGVLHVYSFASERYYAISGKPLQAARLVKVLRAAGSSNLSRFERYGRVEMEIGPRKTTHQETAGALKFVETLGSELTEVSRGHAEFLGLPGTVRVGAPRVELSYRVIRVTW